MKFLDGAAAAAAFFYIRLFVWPMLASTPENFNGKVGISPCTLHAEVAQVMNVDLEHALLAVDAKIAG